MSDTSSTYGPSAIKTWANGVTIARLLVSPGLFVLIAQDGATWGVFALWTGLALTDGLDGWILGALIMLVAIGTFWWVPVALIAVRELGISLLRVWWGRQGRAVPASSMAKLKTFVQALAVGFALLPPTAEHAPWLATGLLWVAVVLTVVSGVQYVVEGRSATTTMGSR
jgi:CDP-diacylglycerol--glycerol-3-phosphate 3-phosphatidyltransferase